MAKKDVAISTKKNANKVENISNEMKLGLQSASMLELANYVKTSGVNLVELENSTKVSDIKKSVVECIRKEYSLSQFVKYFNSRLDAKDSAFVKLVQAYKLGDNFRLSVDFVSVYALRNSQNLFSTYKKVTDTLLKSEKDADNKVFDVKGEKVLKTLVPIAFKANQEAYLRFICTVFANKVSQEKKAAKAIKTADRIAKEIEKENNQLAKLETLSVAQIEKLLADKKAKETENKAA